MSALVETVGIGDAAEGMVLAEDLRDDVGMLLPAGAALAAATLASLRRRGIAMLRIAGQGTPQDSPARRAERERQCERLARLFRRSAQGASGQLLERLYEYRRNG